MGQATPFDLKLTELIAPIAEAMGFELVRVRLQGSSGQRRTLQVMAERPDGTMRVDDCAELSRALSAALDVEDPIEGTYDLEVSSPGIDRPLTRLKDYANWAGFEAKVELARGHDGRRRFKGRLKGVDGDTVKIEAMAADGTWEVMGLPFADIAEGRLILTDDLLAAAAKPGKGIAQGAEVDETSGLEFENAQDEE